MGKPRFTEEFKFDAIKQFTERGYLDQPDRATRTMLEIRNVSPNALIN